MESTSRLVIGRYSPTFNKSNSIYVQPERAINILIMNIKFIDVKEAVTSYFIDELGFALKTFQITATADNDGNPSAIACEIEFVNDGILELCG
jgi:hypothetical protein